MAEWVDEAAEAPAVLLDDRSDLDGAARHGVRDEGVRVIDDESEASGAAAQRLRAEVEVLG